ncbi:Hint domain-containing protein [Lutimaribacter pacificus]|uniref:Hint domain-containing protein n=1 Tax=Lutimaribacter pacificus TaxID=391948 RepID=A0A1H0LHC3_9RHOB|nr:Hint domain-containing protein [Lutimaribacter pacificus]SHK07052.1 Hint domain-containing protein [Lutimaribacter pacificus]
MQADIPAIRDHDRAGQAWPAPAGQGELPVAVHNVTPATWNSVAFWSLIAGDGAGQVLDATSLGSDFTLGLDRTREILTICHDGMAFTVGPAGASGTDATLGRAARFDGITIRRGHDWRGAPDKKRDAPGTKAGRAVCYPNRVVGIVYDRGDPQAGPATWPGVAALGLPDSGPAGCMSCVAAGTRIKTLRGELRAADIARGDMVLTRDAGYQPVRWTGTRSLGGAELIGRPDLRPVMIRAGALGRNQPERDLMVSPCHRMLVHARPGDEEALVAAIDLLFLDGVEQLPTDTGVVYVHLMFDDHQILCSEGAWSESLQPDERTLSGMGRAQREELRLLFPELRGNGAETACPAARGTLGAREVQALALRPASTPRGTPGRPGPGRVEVGRRMGGGQGEQVQYPGMGAQDAARAFVA